MKFSSSKHGQTHNLIKQVLLGALTAKGLKGFKGKISCSIKKKKKISYCIFNNDIQLIPDILICEFET